MKTIALPLCILEFFTMVFCFSCTKTNDNMTAATSRSETSLDNQIKNTTTFAAGDSLVIKGDTVLGDQTVIVQTAFPDGNANNFVSFTALGDALSGNGGLDRSLMKYALRSLPNTLRIDPLQIKKAVLYLYQYHRPADQDPYAIMQTGNNSVELHRIASPWSASSVTWNTQPRLGHGSADTLEDVVIIPAITTPLAFGQNDDQAVDITAMIRKMISLNNGEGILMKLNKFGEGRHYTGRAYGSFTCPELNKRPRLVLYF